MHIAYIGNFVPPHSTENDIKSALENNGHTVDPYQENRREQWTLLFHAMSDYDLVLWTSTKQYADDAGDKLQWQLLAVARRFGVPVVGYHLDRWWNLDREHRIREDPFFRVDLLCTADGGHDEQWASEAIIHQWMPPAIAGKNVGLGTSREEFASDIAFVGNWSGGYHREWKHRHALVDKLQRWYGDRVRFWPKQGQPAVRGDDLKDLYASVKVVVGDSCLVPKVDGSPMTHYCSDRIPETLGRGGILAHPRVEGINAAAGDPFYAPGTWMWNLGDWGELRHVIDLASTSDYQGSDVRRRAAAHIREHHTYEVRVQQLFAELTKRGMI